MTLGLGACALWRQTDADAVMLCAALLDGLEESKPEHKGKLSLIFDNACESVDLSAKKVTLAKGVEAYDLLIAADGVNSVVRSSVSHPAFAQLPTTSHRMPQTPDPISCAAGA